MPALIELRQASAGYAGRAVLHDIDLTINAGERVAVMGRSGAGKSTLLNLLHARLADKLFERAGTLSGGQQQRTSVARALYNDRSIVIGDEPVSALDRLQGAEILGKLCARHDTAILAMHDIPLALAHADRVVVMDEGRIVLDAPARTISAVDLVPYYSG